MKYDVRLVEANVSRGFHWPYYISIPTEEQGGLFVIPNNTGKGSDDFEIHLKSAEQGVRKFPRLISGAVHLTPVFPRPSTHWQYYTHALDRDTILIDSSFDPTLIRIDLQLIAMVEDAASQFGLQLRDRKFMMCGFSAAGQFVNRFTLLHPECVDATIAGSCGGHMVPIEKLDSTPLPFPIGVSDCEQITGHLFDGERFRRIPHLFLLGENDTNDPVAYDDGYSQEERAIIYGLFGGEGELLRRFRKVECIFQDFGVNSIFKVYRNTGHEFTQEMFRDVQEFVSKVC